MLLYVSSFVTILLLLYIQLAAVNARVAVDRTAKGSVSGAERHGAVTLVLAHAVIYPALGYLPITLSISQALWMAAVGGKWSTYGV